MLESTDDDRKLSPLDKLLAVDKISDDKINIKSTQNLRTMKDGSNSPTSLNTHAQCLST